MARQTFEKGQKVYTRSWANNWREGIVAEPDTVKQSYGYRVKSRDIHYVRVSAVQPDGMADAKRTFDVLNNRQHIITEEVHAEIAQAKDIGKLRQTIDAHRVFEMDFAKYVEQARIILEAQVTKAGRDDIDDLTHYLRGMFHLRSDLSRQSRIDVRKVRADNLAAAQKAQASLRALGQTPPELPS